MTSLNLVSLVGWFGICGTAWVFGGCRRPVPWRTIIGSTLLTFVLAAAVFLLPASRYVLLLVNDVILALLGASSRGAEFLLGPLALAPGQQTAAGELSIGVVLAAQVLPAVIFFASLMAVLHHYGVVAPVVRAFGRLFHRTLGLSGAEALAGALHMFFGVETAAAIRPYLPEMTRSELLTVIATNLATSASTVLAIYVIFLRESFPQIAGHLVSASLLSIPCAVLAVKLMLPETETPKTWGAVPPMESTERHSSALGALAEGAMNGIRIAAAISAILIAVLGVVALVDTGLAQLSLLSGAGEPMTLARMLGFLMTPWTWMLGIESADLAVASKLLGQRLVLTEVVSYQQLGLLANTHQVSPRTLVIVSYALCGFAHVGGMGIALGGFGALAPKRLDDLAALALRGLAAATLATLLTGTVAGIFYTGQHGILGI